MDIIYWSVRSCSRRRGYGVKRVVGGIVILVSSEHHFIRVNENMVQHPTNNKSILLGVLNARQDLNLTCVLSYSELHPAQSHALASLSSTANVRLVFCLVCLQSTLLSVYTI